MLDGRNVAKLAEDAAACRVGVTSRREVSPCRLRGGDMDTGLQVALGGLCATVGITLLVVCLRTEE